MAGQTLECRISYQDLDGFAMTLTKTRYGLVAVRSSGILKAKQKLGVTFNFDKFRLKSLKKM